MTYATRQEMIDRFGEEELTQLTDQLDLGAIDDVRLGKALADADDEINTYLASRYTLPLTAVPTVLKRVAADIARYYLYDDRATEQVTKRHSDALRWLREVANGSASLGPDVAGVEVDAASGAVEFAGATPVFGRSSTEGF